jgi:dynamin GTPase
MGCMMMGCTMFLQIVAIASASLDEYRVESKKMVIALVDMERSFIPPQHFIRLVQRR